MKVLVFGAGVLGSYLAYELGEAGHDVSILARGERYQTLLNNGLVIEHFMQKMTSVSQVKAVEVLRCDDAFDAVFAVMQKTQIEQVLPLLAANEKCPFVCLVGNNGQAPKTLETLMRLSRTKPKVAFAFLGAGGKREGTKVISIHRDAPSFNVGSINQDISYKTHIDALLENTKLKVNHSDNIDAWLKYHLALILPAVYMIHYASGDMKKLAREQKVIQQCIDAIKEGFAALQSLGYPPEPPGLKKFFEKPVWLLRFMFKLMIRSRKFELAARDHAMAAVGEMNMLSDEFTQIIKSTDALTPALKKLSSYLIRAER